MSPLPPPFKPLPCRSPSRHLPPLPRRSANYAIISRIFWALANPLGNIRDFDDVAVKATIVKVRRALLSIPSCRPLSILI